MCRRMNRPSPSKTTPARNGSRQPQLKNWSSGGGDRREGAVGQEEPGGHARLGGAGVETAAAVVAVLHHEDHGAAPFAPHAQPLDERNAVSKIGQHTDLVIGR